jgi:hypothetical protein
MAEPKVTVTPVPETPDAPAPAPQTAEDAEQALLDDYSQYVAVHPINHGNARAYNVGDPVPATNVKLHGYDARGLVRKVK